jgi:ABC-type antimicrobial peptide transport system ATPase subunit
MVAAVGSSTLQSGSTNGISPVASLEAQITRYQKQLSDCVNCSSANTIEGKKNIQQISDKISIAKAKIEQIKQTQLLNQPARSDNQTNAAATPDATAALPASINAVTPAPGSGTTQSVFGTVGSLINVSA